MFKSGLLVLTAPLPWLPHHINKILQSATKHVSETLYIHLQPGWPEENQRPGLCRKSLMLAMTGIYSGASSVCSNVDVRILFNNFTEVKPLKKQFLKKNYEIILTDFLYEGDNVSNDINKLIEDLYPRENLREVKSVSLEVKVENQEKRQKLDEEEIKIYDHTVLGGTFDRLHNGHKILLTEACLLSNKSLTVGVTDGRMNDKKTLCELIEPTVDRIQIVKEYLEDIKPSLEYKVVPIIDPFGPSIVDPELECIIVSEETLRGGQAVNKRREEKGLSTLEIHVIELVEDVHHSPEEEVKISSSSSRKRLLGTLIKQTQDKPGLSSKPYVIGLTGGIASGKSSVCKRLEKLGAAVVDCDKLGHKAYIRGSETFEKVVAEFGPEIIGSDGEIDKKTLGSKVFSSKESLNKLNSIVWPAIADLAKQQTSEFARQGSTIVLLDAAVLLEAGWDSFVNEVWVCVVPRDEAVKRIVERNNLTEEQATQRINSQISNQDRVNQANVVLSTLWEPEVTQKQVEKAWALLQSRIQ